MSSADDLQSKYLSSSQLSHIRDSKDFNDPRDVSSWVNTLREQDLPRSAERALADYLTESRPATKALGWPRQDYQHSGQLRRDQPEMRLPREGRHISDLSVQPDESQYLVPKFRGIHYRDEQSSRFHDPATYKSHYRSSQLKEDTLSAAIYKSSTLDPEDDRRRITLKAQREFSRRYGGGRLKSLVKTENRLRKMFGDEPIDHRMMRSFDELRYVKPDLAEDVIDQTVFNRSNLPPPKVRGFKQTPPEHQQTSLQFEEQMYVNTMDKYDRFQREQTGDFGAFQVSLTDNPAHAAKYAYGEKFTTPRQSRYKSYAGKKRKRSDEADEDSPSRKKRKRANHQDLAQSFLAQDTPEQNPASVRRTEGTVGKLYTYLMPPSALYPDSRVPELTPMTTTILRRRKEIALKPNQARELETTFFTQVPKQHLALERRTKVPSREKKKYQAVSFTPTGSSMRNRFADKQVSKTWKRAQEEASRRRKILMPHGTFDTVFKQRSPKAGPSTTD